MSFDAIRKLSILGLCLVVFMAAGCSNNNNNNDASSSNKAKSHNVQILVDDNQVFSNVKVHQDRNGQLWVPLKEAAQSMNLEVQKVDGSYKLGDTDPICSVKMNDKKAWTADKTVNLPNAPKMIQNQPYITVQSLSALLETPVQWDGNQSAVMIEPIDDSGLAGTDVGQAGGFSAMSTATTASGTDIIAYGKRFLGTPYKFGAKSNVTSSFDCSSYVQYVYKRFGVSLPRSSRSQSKVGRTVSQSQMKTGDLMFFYTPGRYSSNKIVGHVGIYAGNGKVLHTYGKPGVTVTDFSTSWKKRFLFAKRVI